MPKAVLQKFWVNMLDNVQHPFYDCKRKVYEVPTMHEQETKSEVLGTRIEPSLKRDFDAMAANHPGTPSDVLRWLMRAFADGRVTVEPPKKEYP